MLPSMAKRVTHLESDDLLTPGQAARITGLTPGGLAKMADTDRLSAIRPGGTHRRYLRSEIEALARFQPIAKRGATK